MGTGSRQTVNDITGQIVDAAVRVHSVIGPGALESAYTLCMTHELTLHGLEVQRQQTLPIVYRGTRLDAGYRLDLIVERTVVVEVKAAARLLPVHEAQLLSYLRLGGYPIGLLINFHEQRVADGIKRMVNSWRGPRPRDTDAGPP